MRGRADAPGGGGGAEVRIDGSRGRPVPPDGVVLLGTAGGGGGFDTARVGAPTPFWVAGRLGGTLAARSFGAAGARAEPAFSAVGEGAS
jgi:hypothetical protein